MKKFITLLALAALAFTTVDAQRFGTPPAGDNTGRTLTYAYSTKAYAATLALRPNAYENIYKVDSLTGTMTVTISTNSISKVCDRTTIMFVSDSATAGHVVTFSTGTAPSATLTVDKNQRAAIEFIFNGGVWIEVARSKE
jgi:hypothetical protein